MTEEERAAGVAAPVTPPQEQPPKTAEEKARRKPANRGKAGGRRFVHPVRLNDAEQEALSARAAAAGLTIGGYLRAAALGDAGPKAHRLPSLDKQLIGAGIAGLNKIGSNLNQIARAENIGKEQDPAYVHVVLAEVNAAVAELLAAYRR